MRRETQLQMQLVVFSLLASTVLGKKGPCGRHRERLLIDWDLASVSTKKSVPHEVTLSANTMMGVEVEVTATAELLNSDGSYSPGKANLYPTQYSNGKDSDLEAAGRSIGATEVLITQARGAKLKKGPNDAATGSRICVEFGGDVDSVDIVSMPFLDVESETEVTFKRKNKPDAKVKVDAVPNANALILDLASQGSKARGVTKFCVPLWESGAIGDLELCVKDKDGTGGDPHVYTDAGDVVDVYLPVGPWISMMSGDDLALQVHVFNQPGMVERQWYDGVAVVNVTSGATVANVTLADDVNAEPGKIVDFGVELGGETLVDTNQTYVAQNPGSPSASVQVKADKVKPHGKSLDRLLIQTPGFSFVVMCAFGGQKHIDLHFTSIDRQLVHGPLVEIIYGDELSAEALSWIDEASAVEEA